MAVKNFYIYAKIAVSGQISVLDHRARFADKLTVSDSG